MNGFIKYVVIISAILISSVFGSLYARTIKIKIVVTSDIHATVFPYDFTNNQPLGYGLANLQSLLDVVRVEHQNRIILLDNGDLIQGQPTGYWANYIDKNKVNLFARVMNHMKYDAATVGNHDIEAGPEVYNKVKEQMKFPWLAANVIDKKTSQPYFQPYVILNRSGVKIAVLGLLTTAVPDFIPESLYEGLEFQDMVESAEFWIKHIKEKEKPDAIIGLFHSGFGLFDPEKPEKRPYNQASAYIAHFVPGFDVIFTGHDHLEVNKNVININGDSVLVIGSGAYGKNIAVAHLDFKRESKRNITLESTRGEIFKIAGLPPSPAFMMKFEKDINEVFEYTVKKVGSIPNEISNKESLFGNSASVDFMHEIQVHYSEADISFAAPLNPEFRVSPGNVYVRDLFSWYPFENYLVTLELTGEEILNYLEYNYGLWYNCINSEDDFLFNYYLDNEGNLMTNKTGMQHLKTRIYNYDSAHGINYVVDVSKPQGERVSIVSMSNGEAFDLSNKYKVALNSYRGSGGGLHLFKGANIEKDELKARVISISEKRMRNLMIDYIESKGNINPEKADNWKIIPEEWVEKIKQREIQTLWP
jgi:2',3'-cyclic-nucleotide 2'-phosphodiesterase / 3'-nucleotidase